jgi:GTP-binding protein
MRKTLAIVGRPNVGKSTLFNRLAGERAAIVDDAAGITRDWIEATAEIGGLHFRVLDTAGWLEGERDALAGRAAEQTERVLAMADGALFVLDARAGVTPADAAVARVLRRSGKPVVLIANKCEGARLPPGLAEIETLGFGEPAAISAEHDEGMAELIEALLWQMPAVADATEPTPGEARRALRVAIVGRPNVGKSTLVNRLLGEERMLTAASAGTTRDAVMSRWDSAAGPIDIVDTAGIRRKAKIAVPLERRAAEEALSAMRLAEVAILVIDATMPLERQDLHIGRAIAEEGRALVVVANKWDLVEDRDAVRRELEARVGESLPQFKGVPIVRLSAQTGHGVDRLLPAVVAAHEAWNRRVPTAALNRWLETALERHQPPAVSGRRIRIRYATQKKARPPTFVLFVSQVEALPDAYINYLARGLRQAFDMPGTPIRFVLRKADNPFAKRGRARNRVKPRRVRRVR